MIYLNTETLQYPVFETDIRRMFTNVSFAEDFDPPDQFVKVLNKTQPEFDHLTERVREEFPCQSESGWTQKWSIVKLDEASASNNIREERDHLLQMSDWTQIPDSPVDKDAWAAYRQELRDITAQPGFPYSVVWPQAPL